MEEKLARDPLENPDEFLTMVRQCFYFAIKIAANGLWFLGKGHMQLAEAVDGYQETGQKVLEEIAADFPDPVEQQICSMLVVSIMMLRVDSLYRQFIANKGLATRVPSLTHEVLDKGPVM